ncbi:MAG: ABC transporter permease [Deinococcales bacterium]
MFLIPRIIGGDPARIMLGERASATALERLREELGLTKPLFLNPEAMQQEGPLALFKAQYPEFVLNALKGDLGRSIFRLTEVRQELAHRFPATLELALLAMLFAVVIGIPAGVIAALYHRSYIDTGIMFLALAGVSFPIFWLAIIMIYIFAVNLGWLPPSGRSDPILFKDFTTLSGLYLFDTLIQRRFDLFVNALKHIILPSIALGTIPLAIVVRMTRSAMLDILSQDYIRTAKAKGLMQRLVINKHALRNALLPVVTVVGLSFGSLLSGAILTETVFAWPGIGRWVYEAIASRDYPIIQGGVLFAASIFVVVNLLVDLSYALIDPRIQYR